MQLDFLTADVFTDTRFTGNPLAVIPNAAGLTGEQMQTIAAEFNLSETTFVLPPADPAHTARVRIFTPRAELPFAGHPNVGTAYLLALHDKYLKAPFDGEAMLFEEIAGMIRVELIRDGGKTVGARLRSPQNLTIGQSFDAEIIAAACGLPADAINLANHPPLLAGCGTNLILAELAGLDALRAAAPQTEVFRKHLGPGLTVGIHIYVPTEGGATDIACRMFAPMHGIVEDPATGAANVGLIGLLAHLHPDHDLDLVKTIAQGVEMGRPSRLVASAEKRSGRVTATYIGGQCVPVLRGTIDI